MHPRREEGPGLGAAALQGAAPARRAAAPSPLPGCWVILAALPWLGSLQTSRDAGERPLHPQQEGSRAPDVSGSWDQSLQSSLRPGRSSSPRRQQGFYFFLVIEGGWPIPLLQVPADLGKEREVNQAASFQGQLQACQPGERGSSLVPAGALRPTSRARLAEAGPTLRAAPPPNSASCCLKPGLGLATGRTVRTASSTSWQLSSVTAMT